MFSIPQLKDVRKWRDRAFLAKEWAFDRIKLSGRKRVLAWPPWQDFETQLRRGFAGTRHEVHFAPVPPGGGDFDLVVPLTSEQIIACAEDEVLRRRNPLPLARRDVIELCDDKGMWSERMRALGFERWVPGEPASGCYPYFLKKRCDSGSREVHRIDGPTDEQRHAGLLASPEFIRQESVPGDVEFAAHVLHLGGRTRRALTMRYWMPGPLAIKWRDKALLQRRCSNDARHLRLFESMLNALEFEGICCINYKVIDGQPRLFEINPRIGLTLGYFLPTFLRSLAWERDQQR